MVHFALWLMREKKKNAVRGGVMALTIPCWTPRVHQTERRRAPKRPSSRWLGTWSALPACRGGPPWWTLGRAERWSPPQSSAGGLWAPLKRKKTNKTKQKRAQVVRIWTRNQVQHNRVGKKKRGGEFTAQNSAINWWVEGRWRSQMMRKWKATGAGPVIMTHLDVSVSKVSV